MSWAAPVPLSMRYAWRMASPSRSSSGVYPLPCWRKCVLHSGICWRWGRFVQANHRGAMRWSWSERRMVFCASVSISDASTCRRRRICTLCPAFRRHCKAWRGQHISHQWISSQASGKSRWLQNHNNTWPSRWVTSGSTSLPACRLGCIMCQRLSSVSCKTPWGKTPGRCHCLWLHGGGALGAPLHCVQEVLGVQFETQAFKVLVFPVGNRLPGSSHLAMGNSA